jgi:hypothetical protein
MQAKPREKLQQQKSDQQDFSLAHTHFIKQFLCMTEPTQAPTASRINKKALPWPSWAQHKIKQIDWGAHPVQTGAATQETEE